MQYIFQVLRNNPIKPRVQGGEINLTWSASYKDAGAKLREVVANNTPYLMF